MIVLDVITMLSVKPEFDIFEAWIFCLKSKRRTVIWKPLNPYIIWGINGKDCTYVILAEYAFKRLIEGWN